MSCKWGFVSFITCIAFATFFASGGNATLATPLSATVPLGDPAIALVQRFNMGAGLESLANQVAHATTTFGIIAKEHGAAEANQLVKAEISKALPTYQKRWNRNLALIYSKHFSAEELRSLTALGKSSPYAGKFRSTHAVVGGEMRASQLLQKLVTEALTAVAKG
ncbi:MAG: hypothetical protein ABI114_06420 [Rhodanobacter sp.]